MYKNIDINVRKFAVLVFRGHISVSCHDTSSRNNGSQVLNYKYVALLLSKR